MPAKSSADCLQEQEAISRAPFCFWEICAVVRGGPGGTRHPPKSFGGAAPLYKHCLSVFFKGEALRLLDESVDRRFVGFGTDLANCQSSRAKGPRGIKG